MHTAATHTAGPPPPPLTPDGRPKTPLPKSLCYRPVRTGLQGKTLRGKTLQADVICHMTLRGEISRLQYFDALRRLIQNSARGSERALNNGIHCKPALPVKLPLLPFWVS